jgi:hypothetical protein
MGGGLRVSPGWTYAKLAKVRNLECAQGRVMLTQTIDREPIAADEDELAGLAELERLIRDGDVGELRLVGRMGEAVSLTESAMRVLRRTIGALAEGRVVNVRQMPRDLTTSLAAELLGTTHAYLMQLLDQGAIASHEEHGAPRIRFEDLMVYKRVRSAERRRILDEMAQESQDLEAMRTGSR